jgi:ferritin-like metal-binding protein YciE
MSDDMQFDGKGFTMNEKDVLISWLNDAYGMEKALVQILEHQVKDAKEYPEVEARLQLHLDETRSHAQLVQSSIERLGGHTSTIKSGIASLFGQVQAVSTGPAKDELVKNSLADFAAENFEIASYRSLIAAADEVNDQETVTMCQQILRDEEAMAQWLDRNIPVLTQATMRAMAGTPVG